MNQVEKQVLDSINIDEMIGYICELISIPSMTGDEKEAQDNVAAKLESIGMKVDRWSLDLDELRKHPDYSIEVNRKEGHGVVGVMGARARNRQGYRSPILSWRQSYPRTVTRQENHRCLRVLHMALI